MGSTPTLVSLAPLVELADTMVLEAIEVILIQVRLLWGALRKRGGMAYAPVSKAVVYGHAGSTPVACTMILLDNEDITILYFREPTSRAVWEGYYTKVKETGYWYNCDWRWGQMKRMRYAGQVKQLNARLAQLVRASV